MVAGVRNLGYDTNASAMELSQYDLWRRGGYGGRAIHILGTKAMLRRLVKGDEVAGNVTPGDTGVIFFDSGAQRVLRNQNRWVGAEFRQSSDTRGNGNDSDFNAVCP
jgi:hypothetical protein